MTPTDELLDGLVADCLAALDDGGPNAVAAFLEAHPEAAEPVRARLRQLESAGLLVRGADAYPERLGDFVLLDRLGSGGMGVVFRARQESLGREVALKLIRPEHLYFPTARERFRREVEVVASLDHPGIVPVYLVDEVGGVPFFAMQLVRGASLAEVLGELCGAGDVPQVRPEKLDGAQLESALARSTGREPRADDLSATPPTWVEAVLRIALQAAHALAHAHAHGVLHRDVKPSNLMLAAGARVLLTDFGLASSMEADAITRTGALVGSAPYTPPEHLRGEELDARSDVYSLGVTLFELLALEAPYRGANVESLQAQILAGKVPSLRARNTAVPWDVETVVATAIDPDPRRRYGSAEALARDLENLLALRPIEARRPGPGLRAKRWAQRRPALAVGVVMGVLLALVAPSVWALVQRSANLEIATSQARAEENLDVALESILGMLGRFGDADLKELPLLQQTRLEFLEQAFELHQRVRAQRPGERALRLQEARIAFSIGEALEALGRLEEALPWYERHVAEYEQATAAPSAGHARLPEHRRELARGWNAIALVNAMLGRGEAQMRAQRSAAEHILEAAELEPTNAQHRIDACTIYANLADHLLTSGASAEAAEAARRGLEVLGARPDEGPAGDPVDRDVSARWHLARARARVNAAHARQRAGGPDAAEDARVGFQDAERALEFAPDAVFVLEGFAEVANNVAALLPVEDGALSAEILDGALAALRRLLERQPDAASHRAALGRVLGNRAIDAFQRGDRAGGLAFCAQAGEAFEMALAANPGALEHELSLARVLSMRADVLLFEDPSGARIAAARSVEFARRGVAGAPHHVGARETLVQCLHVEANAAQSLGDYRATEDLVREALELAPTAADAWRMSAELWIDCATLAGVDPDLEGTDRGDLVERYLDRALDAYQGAYDRGYRDASGMRGYTDLDELHARAEFGALLERMATPDR